jgi:hypothetical protein
MLTLALVSQESALVEPASVSVEEEQCHLQICLHFKKRKRIRKSMVAG